MHENSVYALQYAIANEYPTRPIFYGGVSVQFISTVSWGSFELISLLAIILGLLMIVWSTIICFFDKKLFNNKIMM